MRTTRTRPCGKWSWMYWSSGPPSSAVSGKKTKGEVRMTPAVWLTHKSQMVINVTPCLHWAYNLNRKCSSAHSYTHPYREPTSILADHISIPGSIPARPEQLRAECSATEQPRSVICLMRYLQYGIGRDVY